MSKRRSVYITTGKGKEAKTSNILTILQKKDNPIEDLQYFSFFIFGELVAIRREENETESFWQERLNFIMSKITQPEDNTSIQESEELVNLIAYSWIHCNKIFFGSKYEKEIEKNLRKYRKNGSNINSDSDTDIDNKLTEKDIEVEDEEDEISTDKFKIQIDVNNEDDRATYFTIIERGENDQSLAEYDLDNTNLTDVLEVISQDSIKIKLIKIKKGDILILARSYDIPNQRVDYNYENYEFTVSRYYYNGKLFIKFLGTTSDILPDSSWSFIAKYGLSYYKGIDFVLLPTDITIIIADGDTEMEENEIENSDDSRIVINLEYNDKNNGYIKLNGTKYSGYLLSLLDE